MERLTLIVFPLLETFAASRFEFASRTLRCTLEPLLLALALCYAHILLFLPPAFVPSFIVT